MASIINKTSTNDGNQLYEFVWDRPACKEGLVVLDSELAARLATAVRQRWSSYVFHSQMSPEFPETAKSGLSAKYWSRPQLSSTILPDRRFRKMRSVCEYIVSQKVQTSS